MGEEADGAPASARALSVRRAALPPALFVGRQRELKLARAMLARRRVVVAWGLGGLGKSALLRALLDKPSRSSAVEVRATQGAGLRAIVGSLRAAWTGESTVPKDDASLASAVVELADARGATLIVDDAHTLKPHALEQLLLAFADYAERSTLLVSTRERPSMPSLAEQILRLDPLEAKDVAALVRGCRPDISDAGCAEIVQRAAGSPWLARCLATGDEGSSTSIAAGLDEPSLRTIEALRWIEGLVSEALVDHIAEMPGTARSLEARAFLDRVGDQLRLHDVAREHFAKTSRPDPSAAKRALARIIEQPGLAATCTALALAAAVDDRETLARLVAARGASFLGEGLAASAWLALSKLPPDVETTFRLACASKSGLRPAVDWAVSLAAPAEPGAVIAWAECMHHSARAPEARGALREVARSTSAEAPAAAALVSRTARTEAEALDALEILNGIPAGAGMPASLRSAAMSRALIRVGRVEESIQHADDALRSLDTESAPSRELVFLLFSFYVNVGRFMSATRVKAKRPELFDPITMGAPEQFDAAMHALETGDMKSAAARIELLRRRTESHDAERFLLGYLQFRRAYAAGDIDEARRALRDLYSLASKRPDFLAWTRIAAIQLSLLERLDPPAWQWPSDLERSRGHERDMLEIMERRARTARGEDAGFEDIDVPRTAIDAWGWRARLEAECRSLRGDHTGAIRCIRSAVEEARVNNAFLLELELLETQGWVYTKAGDTSATQRTGAELEALAARAGLPRFVALGRSFTGQLPASAILQPAAITLEPGRRAVHLATGRVVDLGRNELGFRILEELVRGAGRATKEHLVRTAWGSRTYDPQRDDKRVQMAIRRLRVLLEQDPAAPELLLTTHDGYALSGPATCWGDVTDA